MLTKIKKQYNFYCCTDQKIYRYKLLLSLLVILMGIFLWPHTAYPSDITSENIIALTNQERAKLGLEKLTVNQLLSKAAYQKGEAILASQIFQHNIGDKKFSSWIREAGYLYSYVGENLAIDFVTSEGAIKAWLKSTTHKKNLLNPYFSETGVAAVEGKFNNRNTILVVQIFGTPSRLSINPKILGINTNGFPLTKNNQAPLNSSLTWQISPGQKLNPENFLTHAVYGKTNSIYQSVKLNNRIANSKLITLPAYSYNTFKENSYLNNKIFLNAINPLQIKTYNINISQFFNLAFILIPLTLLLFLFYLYFYYFLKLRRFW